MKLYLNYLSNHIFQNSVLFILVAFISSLGILCISDYTSLINEINVYKAYGFDQIVTYYPEYSIYENMEIDSGNSNIPDSLIDQVNYLECVSYAEYDNNSTITTFVDEYPNYSFGLMTITLPENLNNFPWKIVQGRMPDFESEDEICISNNLIEYWNLGDIIELVDVDLALNETTNLQLTKSRFTIVGFFDVNSSMLFGDSFAYSLSQFGGNTVGYAMTYFNKPVTKINRNIMLVYPEVGYSPKEVSNMVNAVTGRGEALTFEDYKTSVFEKNADNMVIIKAITIVSFLLMIVVLVSCTVIQLSIRKKELAVYYLNGGTWFGVCMTASFTYLPSVILGIIGGIVLYRVNPIFVSMTNGSYIWSISAILFVSAFILGVFLLLSLIFCVISYRHSPIEVMRYE